MTADIEDKKDYESMDKTQFLDEYFFKILTFNTRRFILFN